MFYATLIPLLFLSMLCTTHAILFPNIPTPPLHHQHHTHTSPFSQLTNPHHSLTHTCNITHLISHTTLNPYINPPQYNPNIIQSSQTTHTHDNPHLHNFHPHHKQHLYQYIPHQPSPTNGTIYTHTILQYNHTKHCRHCTHSFPPHPIISLINPFQTLHSHHIHPSTYSIMTMTSHRALSKHHSDSYFHPTSPPPFFTHRLTFI